VTALETALALDRADRLVEAAWAYEVALREENFPLEACLNLAGVYCVLGDFGYASSIKIERVLEDQLYPATESMLRQARAAHPNDSELPFWELYCREQIIGVPVATSEYEKLAAAGGSLLPRLELVGKSNSGLTIDQAEQLLATVREGKTAREREVRAVLMSVVRELGERYPDLKTQMRVGHPDPLVILKAFKR
jgi:hypothetical protein